MKTLHICDLQKHEMSHAEDATGIEAYYRVVTGWAVAVVGSDIKKLVQEGNLVLLRRSGA